MPAYISLGRRKNDYGLMVDFLKDRIMVRADTTRIPVGIPLEPMRKNSNGFAPGMLLTHNDWKNLYFLMEHPGWTDDDYFEMAKVRMKELGIKKP